MDDAREFLPAAPAPAWPPPAPTPAWPPPADWPPATTPPDQRPQRTTRPQGALGALAAIAAGLLKYGLVLFKVGKFGPMLISMVVSLWLLTTIFGWKFGAGVLALIAVHEFGHVLAARYERVDASLPLFLGPLGAFISVRGRIRDARQEAVIGIGGPVLGTLGALACAGLADITPSGSLRNLLVALAWFGFFINLFNLTPMVPFDGGRVAGAVSVWLNVAGVLIMGGLIFLTARSGVGVNPLIVLLFILGLISTFQRFRNRHNQAYFRSVPKRTRAIIACAWAGLIIITAVGMSVAHRQLVDSNVIDRPGDSSSDEAAAVGAGPAAQLARDVDDLAVVDDQAWRVCSAAMTATCQSDIDTARQAALTLQGDLTAAHIGPSLPAAASDVRLDYETAQAAIAGGDSATASRDLSDAHDLVGGLLDALGSPFVPSA